MDLFQAVILGIVQGATEFLPISSSGHLVLIPWWLNWNVPSDLVFAVAVHLGTLLAVLIYFRQDWINLIIGAVKILRTRNLSDPYSRLFAFLVVGSIPVAVLGLLFSSAIDELLEAPGFVAGFLVVTAGLLFFSERQTAADKSNRSLSDLTVVQALIIGTAQLLALAPGISRSGSTIAAGLFAGISRTEAARFSFLLGTPAILGAGLKTLLDFIEAGSSSVAIPSLAAGFVSAALVGYLSIAFLLKFLQQRRLYVFAGYCAVFGVMSLVAVFIGR